MGTQQTSSEPEIKYVVGLTSFFSRAEVPGSAAMKC